MKLKIKSNSTLFRRYLQLLDDEIVFFESVFISGKNRFDYNEVEAVYLSANNMLSIQLPTKSFSILVKPTDPQHKLVIDTLVQRLQLAQNR